MANTIDWSTLALGTLIGVGCRKQLKSAAKVAATTVASLTSSAAIAANSAAAQMYDQPEKTGQQINQSVGGKKNG